MALLACAPVSRSVTLDANGTVGVLHTTGKVNGLVRYRGKRAIVSARERGAEATPAVTTEEAVPRLRDEMTSEGAPWAPTLPAEATRDSRRRP